MHHLARRPVGVPALFAYILVSLRKKLRDDAVDDEGELVRNDNRSIDRFAFFFDVYKPSCWWWEIYESIRRVACTGVLVLFPLNSVLQLNLAMFLTSQGVVMYTHFKVPPFLPPLLPPLAPNLLPLS